MEITESDNTGAPSTSVNEVKAKGQQTDLVLLETYLELDAGAVQLVGSWRLLRDLRRCELTREPDA